MAQAGRLATLLKQRASLIELIGEHKTLEEEAKEATSPAAKARALSAVTATAQGAARDALDYVEKQLAMEH